jgi:hypothetical protein
MKLAMTIAAAVFLAVVIHAADWAATRVLWICAALLLLGAAGLALWHRRKVAELRELHNDVIGGWRRISTVTPWPKECRSCGQPAYSWAATRVHRDQQTSACAAHLARQEAAEDAPVSWSVTVGPGSGEGSVDTLTEAPELET